jgi:hypothetical protein
MATPLQRRSRVIWGVAIVEVEDEADARALTANDPTIKSDRNFRFEIYSMPIAVLRKPAA